MLQAPLLYYCRSRTSFGKLLYIDRAPLRGSIRGTEWSRAMRKVLPVEFGLPRPDKGREGRTADDQRSTPAEPFHENTKYPFELAHVLYEGEINHSA